MAFSCQMWQSEHTYAGANHHRCRVSGSLLTYIICIKGLQLLCLILSYAAL